jgi:hypothetical protein
MNDRNPSRKRCSWILPGLLLPLLAVAIDAGAATHTAQLRLAKQGMPLDELAELQFAVYDVAVGGTARSTHAAPGTPFQDGLANVEFDTGDDSLENRALWIEVRIVDPTTDHVIALTPRIALTPVPIAVVAGRTVASAVNTTAIDPDQVQRRIRTGCAPETPRLQAIHRVGGAAACAVDRGISSITAGQGLNITNGVLAVDLVQTQRRRTPHCEPGASIRQIPVGGTSICVADQSPLNGLTRVQATCTFPGTLGVETGCAATPRCPAQAPVPIGGGYETNCIPATLIGSYPVNDSQGRGWTTYLLKGPIFNCAATATVTAFAYCVAGP